MTMRVAQDHLQLMLDFLMANLTSLILGFSARPYWYTSILSNSEQPLPVDNNANFDTLAPEDVFLE